MHAPTAGEIRARLDRAGPQSAPRGAAPALLGRVLVEMYAVLTGRDPARNLAAPLELADASEAAWQQALIDHAFESLLAPALARHEGALQGHGAAVLEFWQAARELCGWLAARMHAERATDSLRSLESLRRALFAANEEPGLKAWLTQIMGETAAHTALRPAPSAQPSWRDRLPAPAPGGSARVLIGAGADGALHTADLAESQCPHVLVGGCRGSGKTQWLRTGVASLLAVNTPATLRLLLIDPRQSTFGALLDSPFLEEPVLHGGSAMALFDRLLGDLQRRAGLPDPAPRLVVACDDFEDLLPARKADRAALEARLARLAAAGRAAGIHLLFATGRIERALLHGAIGHLPARVALKLPRKAESRLLLGEAGAEALGNGELLYKDLGAPLRLKCLFTADDALAGLAGRSQRRPAAAVH